MKYMCIERCEINRKEGNTPMTLNAWVMEFQMIYFFLFYIAWYFKISIAFLYLVYIYVILHHLCHLLQVLFAE